MNLKRLAEVMYRQPDAERGALRKQVRRELRWIASDDSAAVALREEAGRERARRMAEKEAKRAAEREQKEGQLRDAGLPVLPDLIEWLSGCRFDLLPRRGSSDGGAS